MLGNENSLTRAEIDRIIAQRYEKMRSDNAAAKCKALTVTAKGPEASTVSITGPHPAVVHKPSGGA